MGLRLWIGRWVWWFGTAGMMGLVLAGTPGPASEASGKARQGARTPSTQEAFVPGRIWNIHIMLAPGEYEAMQPRSARGLPLPFFRNPAKPPKMSDGRDREVHRNTFNMDLPWATGAVTLDGQTFTGVGIRYKGNGTIWDASRTIKKSFKIDLDHFGGTARYLGLKTINLHSSVADPSKNRETLAYGLYRAAGVPASQTAFAEVRLTVAGKFNQELLGLYTVVEDVTRPFLLSWFGTDQGLLLKPEGLRDFEYRGEDWARYKKQFLPKRDPTPEEIKRILAFSKLVHKGDDEEFRKEIGGFLHVDGYLRFLAATAFVANTDSFFVLGHNYYLYLHPTTGKFHYIPWDLDRAFSNLPILGSNNQQMNLSFTHPYSGTHRLTERLLALPGQGAKYRELLGRLAATCFKKNHLLKQVEEAEAASRVLLAQEAKAAQARKEGGSGFGQPGMFGKPPALRLFMEKRTESLAAQLAGTSKGHAPAAGFGPGGFNPGAMIGGFILETLDTGKDGKLSRAEWLAVAKKLFDTAPKDADKRIGEKGLAEALAGLPPRPPGEKPGPGPGGVGPANFLSGMIFQRADADKDGKVSQEELMGMAEKLFDQFDRSKTGNMDETAFGELINALMPFPKFGPPPGKPGDPREEGKKP